MSDNSLWVLAVFILSGCVVGKISLTKNIFWGKTDFALFFLSLFSFFAWDFARHIFLTDISFHVFVFLGAVFSTVAAGCSISGIGSGDTPGNTGEEGAGKNFSWKILEPAHYHAWLRKRQESRRKFDVEDER